MLLIKYSHMQDMSEVEGRISELSQLLRKFSEDDWLRELLKHMKQPGWTTPAEHLFARVGVDLMIEQVNVLNNFKEGFMKGAKAVGQR
jgi:hypothetical protein